MKQIFRTGAIVLVVAVAFGLYAAPVIVAQQSPDGVVSSPVMATAAAVAAYWTPERMATAIPRDINPGTPSAAPGPLSGADGPASLVAGNLPGQAAGSVVRVSNAARQDAVPTFPYAYPYPFTRQQVFPIAFFSGGYTQYPFSNNGKLFFTLGATNYVCSATSLTSGADGNASLVLTAGHCVSSGAGTWATNVMFSPGHRDNATPAAFDYDLNTAGTQRWPAYTMYTTSSWFNSGNLRRDFAMIVVRRRIPDGVRLGNVIGTQGLAWNWTDQQHYHSFGYPAAALGVWPYTAFNGQRQWACQSNMARRVTEYAGAGPAPLAIGCDKTGGTSGGGWFMGFNENLTTGYQANGGYLNSVNSWRWISPSQPRALHGPYFDTLVETMWNTARAVVVPAP